MPQNSNYNELFKNIAEFLVQDGKKIDSVFRDAASTLNNHMPLDDKLVSAFCKVANTLNGRVADEKLVQAMLNVVKTTVATDQEIIARYIKPRGDIKHSFRLDTDELFNILGISEIPVTGDVVPDIIYDAAKMFDYLSTVTRHGARKEFIGNVAQRYFRPLDCNGKTFSVSSTGGVAMRIIEVNKPSVLCSGPCLVVTFATCNKNDRFDRSIANKVLSSNILNGYVSIIPTQDLLKYKVFQISDNGFYTRFISNNDEDPANLFKHTGKLIYRIIRYLADQYDHFDIVKQATGNSMIRLFKLSDSMIRMLKLSGSIQPSNIAILKQTDSQKQKYFMLTKAAAAELASIYKDSIFFLDSNDVYDIDSNVSPWRNYSVLCLRDEYAIYNN